MFKQETLHQSTEKNTVTFVKILIKQPAAFEYIYRNVEIITHTQKSAQSAS